MTATRANWLILLGIMAVLGGSCTAIAGDLSHWPATLPALLTILVAKLANDRLRLLKWPMEFLFWAAILMIVFNLVRLYFLPG
ncbi:hypothetical protein SAMN04488103_11523 [Gemmobacter aquatilis]|uniref:Cytochrome C oxidase subunit IV n=1 Tax=Gemmobacter aquatilis TaxID=933059 RepID=A0A1H8MXC4_9RHOB|nr:hypothetical protein [Gemmobacter aquatilis]SEO21923.1 hypothetical protein SAMN04488103_11523 [Gemmobacter aquatilis]